MIRFSDKSWCGLIVSSFISAVYGIRNTSCSHEFSRKIIKPIVSQSQTLLIALRYENVYALRRWVVPTVRLRSRLETQNHSRRWCTLLIDGLLTRSDAYSIVPKPIIRAMLWSATMFTLTFQFRRLRARTSAQGAPSSVEFGARDGGERYR